MNPSFASRWLVTARLSAVALGFTLSAFVACSPDEDTDEPAGDPADCKLIANRCHSYDDGSNLAHECHDVGHEGESPQKCTEMKAQCLAFCPPRDPDSGTGGSAGSAGSGSGATSSGGTSTGGQGAAAGDGSGGAAGSDGAAGQGGTSTGGTNGAGSGGLATGGSGGLATGGSGATSGSGGSGETACATLGRVCHGVGSGFTEECHELGHDGNEPACQAQLAACLAACTDGGV